MSTSADTVLHIQPTEPVDVLNKRLVDYFGKDQIGYAKFRLVWSSDQRERRFVRDKAIYTDYGLFLRYENGWIECDKYEVFPDKWILEELTELDGRNPELPYKFSYEPVWVFGNAGSDPVPNWKALYLLAYGKLFIKSIVQSPSDLEDNDIEKMHKEIQQNKVIISNESPYLAGAIHDGEAVVVPSKSFVQEEVSSSTIPVSTITAE